ncbi:hypothetical protein LEP1GSC163_4147 [Leptospira santarosai str. CBC379]|nr:hypothetical protein LEP1GSC163_4147 [Leptospira santarosai str. CBC379]
MKNSDFLIFIFGLFILLLVLDLFLFFPIRSLFYGKKKSERFFYSDYFIYLFDLLFDWSL